MKRAAVAAMSCMMGEFEMKLFQKRGFGVSWSCSVMRRDVVEIGDVKYWSYGWVTWLWESVTVILLPKFNIRLPPIRQGS